MGRDGHMLWERVEPPYHWKTTGLYIVADRHLNDGTRQHMVEGRVEPGCVRAGAQIMGHKPSATAEKHYTVRPLDLLRLHHEKIEAWVLEQGGVPFVRQDTGRRLKVA